MPKATVAENPFLAKRRSNLPEMWLVRGVALSVICLHDPVDYRYNDCGVSDFAHGDGKA